ncbi:MAG: hypothetical protein LBM20_05015 [Rikenellaceae bacterium]|nr:hypothetical protein [Rikenellaceae bacterium]
MIKALHIMMKVGLIVAGSNIRSKIKTSYNKDYEVNAVSNKSIKLVVFNPLNPDDFRNFEYTQSDWNIIFEEYKDFSNSNGSAPPSLVRAIIFSTSKFDIQEFAKALDALYHSLNADAQQKLLTDIWQLSLYSAKTQHKEIVSVLATYDTRYQYRPEKHIITDSIEYCLKIAESPDNYSLSISDVPPLENKNIFQKIHIIDNLIGRSVIAYEDCNALIRSLYWKNGFWPLSMHSFIPFVDFFYCFTLTGQLNIIRKIAYDIQNSDLKITIPDLMVLIEANTEIKTIHEKYHFNKVDKTLEILICSLDTYSRTGKFLSQGKIFDILTNLKDIHSKYFLGERILFDFCNGGLLNNNRYNPDLKDDNTGTNPYFFDRSHFFQDAPSHKWAGMEECLKDICNGRMSQKRDKEVNRYFLWCYGKRCYRNTIKRRTEFKEYKFIDICSAFNLTVTKEAECGLVANDEYSKFLDTIGKISRISANIYCESCGSILFPVKRSDKEYVNYYNLFSCPNKNCNQHEIKIYLSHCHTSNCRGVIDSRHHKKCPNGMHICPECFGCCSEKFYQNQKRLMGTSGIPTPVSLSRAIENRLGHNDKGEFFCHKCGVELIDNKCVNCGIEHKNFKRYRYQ